MMNKQTSILLSIVALFLTFVLGISIGIYAYRLYEDVSTEQYIIIHNASGSGKKIELIIREPVKLELNNDETKKVDIGGRFSEGGLSIKVDGASHQIGTYLTDLDIEITIVLLKDDKTIYFQE